MKYRKCPLLVVVCGFLFLGVAHGSNDLLMVTHKVWLDVKVKNEHTGRIEIGLFGLTVPKTVQNFIQLAVRPKGHGYVGTKFHRIFKDAAIQAGDFSVGDGTGAESFYGRVFKDENFKIKNYGAGWVGMANRGKDTNGSQFYITTAPNNFTQGTHVVFGKVLSGMDVVEKIEGLKVKKHYMAREDAVIVGCWVLPMYEPFPEYKGSSYDFKTFHT